MNGRTENAPYDVAIVGGGPVGLGLAIDLAQRGVKILVVERSASLHNIPRGQNLTQRSGEHFRAWGVSKNIRHASPIPRSFGNAGMVAYGTLLGKYHYDWFKRGSVNAYYFAENERLPQYETEKVLRKRAAELANITVLYNVQADHVTQYADGVELGLKDRSTNETIKANARYAVGCDGSRSLVRRLAGIKQDIDPHDKRMALLVFRSRELHDLLERYPGKSIFNILNPDLDGYWQFLGRVDTEGTWFYHAPVPQETQADNFDFKKYLHDAVGAEFDVAFDHVGFWDLRIAVARTYQNDRLFIAGDAAHSHPPYGGYGVNTGFEDARNLSWKLAAQIHGWAGPSLLNSYTAERKPAFDSTSVDFIQRMILDDRCFGRTYSPQEDRAAFEQAWADRASVGNADVTQFLPHYVGSPINCPVAEAQCGARGTHMMQARSGHHLAPIVLSDGEDLFDSLGRNFALVSIGGDPEVVANFVASADKLNVPFAVIIDSADQGRDAYQARYIIVRPDHFISWAGDDPEGSELAILGRAIGLNKTE